MNNQHDQEELIDLGAASVETKGGPFGVDDHRASFMPPDGGLTAD
ncbi:MAG TPA: benenodin family lasso peptide [Sphingomicrobium sp.]|nr:benenodin family lasso peptide [Sphingomicrobium sp.]